eukprot:8627654-Pyramimonas_sp.AAC.1
MENQTWINRPAEPLGVFPGVTGFHVRISYRGIHYRSYPVISLGFWAHPHAEALGPRSVRTKGNVDR